MWRGPKKFNFDRQEVTLKFVGEGVDSILPVWYPVLETKNAEEIHFWDRISLFYFISQIINIFILLLFIIQNCRKTFNQINVPLNILISFFSWMTCLILKHILDHCYATVRTVQKITREINVYLKTPEFSGLKHSHNLTFIYWLFKPTYVLQICKIYYGGKCTC